MWVYTFLAEREFLFHFKSYAENGSVLRSRIQGKVIARSETKMKAKVEIS